MTRMRRSNSEMLTKTVMFEQALFADFLDSAAKESVISNKLWHLWGLMGAQDFIVITSLVQPRAAEVSYSVINE